jgi:hypothetical protein
MSAKRKSLDNVSMERAVKAMLNKEMGFLKASKTLNVLRSITKDFVNNKERNKVEAVIGRKPVLPAEVEEELVRHCLLMEQ